MVRLGKKSIPIDPQRSRSIQIDYIDPYRSTTINIDAYRSIAIHIDPYWSISIYIYPHRSISIPYRSILIYINPHRSIPYIDPYRMSIHIDPHRSISHIDPDRSTSIHVDPHRSISIHIDPYRSILIHIDPQGSISMHIDRDRSILIYIVYHSISIHNDPHRSILIYIEYRSTSIHIFPHIHIDPYRSTSIHIDPQRSISIHIDPYRSTTIHIDPHRSRSIHICFRVNPPAWNTILFWLLCNPILILFVYWCRRLQVFKFEFRRSVNWQNPLYILSYEFVPFGSALQEKIENDCDTILDKTCWRMLKSPPNFLNKSRLLWNKVSVAPLPRTMLQQTFSMFNRQFRWQWAQHVTPNQHCPGERGFVSTVLSKIVATL